MKSKSQYVCQNCGYNSPKWLGRCPGCEEWSSFAEEIFSTQRGGTIARPQGPKWGRLSDTAQDSPVERHQTGVRELDRVLGGGLVPDSFVLLGGDPGIGKSTLLLQMAGSLSKKMKVLYVSGEESTEQLKGRARRLRIQGDDIYLATETQLETVFELASDLNPKILIMDSLQTFTTSALESAPGSVGQVREVTARLMNFAKSGGVSVWLVGHVTKEGGIAGPKMVEHMVDTVLYFEGSSMENYRLLRTVKNRFGSTRELGVFSMSGDGLLEVDNPSAFFLNERSHAVPGVAVTATLEGTRPLLVELQALVSQSPLAMPRRTAVGIDQTKISLLAAILERHLGTSLAQQDLFFNVAGGLRLGEPGADLAAIAAIWSSATGIAIPSDWLLMGEVGLTGEVRRIAQAEVRIEEAHKLGFKTVLLPKSAKEWDYNGLKLISVASVQELSRILA